MKGPAMHLVDAMRIRWALARYDFWLDLHGVRRRDRRTLRAELRGNLTEAAAHVGIGPALARLGSLRQLASASAADRRSAWTAGAVVASFAFAATILSFFAASLYFVEGAVDAGADEPVRSALFPFFGSEVKVHDQGAGGLVVEMFPGPLVVIVPLVAFLAVARPWRALGGRREA